MRIDGAALLLGGPTTAHTNQEGPVNQSCSHSCHILQSCSLHSQSFCLYLLISWLHTCSFHPRLKRILLTPSSASTPTSLSFYDEARVHTLATPPNSCVINSSGKWCQTLQLWMANTRFRTLWGQGLCVLLVLSQHLANILLLIAELRLLRETNAQKVKGEIWCLSCVSLSESLVPVFCHPDGYIWVWGNHMAMKRPSHVRVIQHKGQEHIRVSAWPWWTAIKMGSDGLTDTSRIRRPWASGSSPSSGPSRFTWDMVTHPSSTHTKNILVMSSLFKTLEARVNHFTTLSLGFLLSQIEMKSPPYWPWQQFLAPIIKVDNTGHVTKGPKGSCPHPVPLTSYSSNLWGVFDSSSSFPHRKPRVQNCNLRNMGIFYSISLYF